MIRSGSWLGTNLLRALNNRLALEGAHVVGDLGAVLAVTSNVCRERVSSSVLPNGKVR